MKVEDIWKQVSLIQSAGDTANTQNAQSQEGAIKKESANPDAKVEISQASITFNKIKKLVEVLPPERVEKVQRIKEQLMSGQYEVDSKRVAENMLRDTLIDFLKE